MFTQRARLALLALGVVLCAPVVGAASSPQPQPATVGYCVLKGAAAAWSAEPAPTSVCPQAAAVAHVDFSTTNNVTGWYALNVTSQWREGLTDADVMFGAGFAEGFATAAVINEWYIDQLAGQVDEPVYQFYADNLAWTRSQVAALSTTSAHWRKVGLVLQQFDGLFAGAAANGLNAAITETRFWTLGALGDLGDVETFTMTIAAQHTPTTAASARRLQRRREWPAMGPRDFEHWLVETTHCSALIKAAPNGEVFFGHTTWQSFAFMLRMLKRVTIRLSPAAANLTPVETVAFSSYPAALSSTDDFHVTSAGLAVIETSLSIFNDAVYKACSSASLLTSIRTPTANRFSASATAWVDSFQQYNSGTYNNQWIVLDGNLARPAAAAGQKFPPQTLVILEQLPGICAIKDVTEFLQGGGYWPSYNVPYNTTLFNLAGYPQAIQQQGPEMLDYNNCTRAQIFRQRQSAVSSIADMQFIQQYNDYENDPISQGNPVFAIAARGDLSGSGAMAFGGIDSKVSSTAELFAGHNPPFHAICGPTQQQPVFDFRTTSAAVPGTHIGVPQRFDFDWMIV